MMRTRSITSLAGAPALALAALAIAGCGSTGGDGDAPDSSAMPKTENGRSATFGVANGNLGKILVDSQGYTLYLFQRDAGMKSTCTGACAVEWPPLRVAGKPSVGDGANASSVTTSVRSDGMPQVTYNGHPLYRFTGDQKPGDTNGQGLNFFGGLWYVLSSSGNEIITPPGSRSGIGISTPPPRAPEPSASIASASWSA